MYIYSSVHKNRFEGKREERSSACSYFRFSADLSVRLFLWNQKKYPRKEVQMRWGFRDGVWFACETKLNKMSHNLRSSFVVKERSTAPLLANRRCNNIHIRICKAGSRTKEEQGRQGRRKRETGWWWCCKRIGIADRTYLQSKFRSSSCLIKYVS